MNYPRITIITPSFNQASFLQIAIDSVLQQNYPNLEYVIIDGGSTDGSVDIITRHVRHLAWWISEKDGGQADAINKGFTRALTDGNYGAPGHLLAYLNSDDVYEPGALRNVAEFWMESRAGIPAHFDRDETWIAGDILTFGDGFDDFTTAYAPELTEDDRYIWFHSNPVHGPAAFWAADLFRRFGPFNTALRYLFDYGFFMRLRFQANIRPLHLEQTLVRFRLHEGSKTVSERSMFEAEFENVRKEISAQLTPHEQRDMEHVVRKNKADRLQAAALTHIEEGRRGAALSELAESILCDPRLLWQRRTAAAIKRLFMPRETSAPPNEK